MIKFFRLVLRNLTRNRVRTALTGLAVVVLAMVYAVASSTTELVNRLVKANSSQNRLLVLDRWLTPSRFPSRYVAKVAEIPAIEDWTVWHYYFGFFDESKRADRFGIGIATRMGNLRAMHPGLEGLDPALIEAMQREKTGALVGPQIAENMNWRVGQRFTLIGSSHSGTDLEFKMVGLLPPGQWANNFFFRDDYYRQGTGDEETVSIMWLSVRDAKVGERVAAEVERMFANSAAEVKVETEAASVARLAGKAESLMTVVNGVVVILLVDILIILANSISITTRERRSEMAVLKVLGFQPTFVMVLVVAEAALVGAVGGAVGAGLACAVSAANEAGMLPMAISFLSQFPVPAEFILRGMALGALAGVLGSMVPAWNARKVRVSDVFAKIA
jgi:putative ABC transport system permease protein